MHCIYSSMAKGAEAIDTEQQQKNQARHCQVMQI